MRPPSFGDFIQPFQIEAPGLRGRLVRLGSALERVIEGHHYPEPVAVMLAEAAVMSAVLASGLKYDGVFTMQVHGDGPLRLLVVDVNSDGGLRGYARFDPRRLEATGAVPEAPVPRLFGNGRIAFTVDQGSATERYQGIAALEGATLTDCAHTYFRQSEQIETAIILCASLASEEGACPRAAALTIQKLPTGAGQGIADDDEDDWRRAVVMMSTVTATELLDPSLTADQILYRLFHDDGVRVFRQRPLRHDCRCSRERVERTLRSFPRTEVMAMVEDGRLTVTCEFCKARYEFAELQWRKLWSDG